jgi:hypothetical protein
MDLATGDTPWRTKLAVPDAGADALTAAHEDSDDVCADTWRCCVTPHRC